MELEEAKKILLQVLPLNCNEVQEAIKRVLDEIKNPASTVNIIDENHQEYCGLIFCKNNHGHYEKTIGLTRLLCLNHGIEVPNGYEIHHIDENKDNNDISNLQVLTKAEHKALHNKRRKFVKFICRHCGKEFETNALRKLYCSKKCYEAYRKEHNMGRPKSDNRKCVICGKEFETLKKSKRKYCSEECRKTGYSIIRSIR